MHKPQEEYLAKVDAVYSNLGDAIKYFEDL